MALGRFSVYVHTLQAATTWRLFSALSTDANFGTTVEATEADFISTHENVEGDVAVTATGWVSWDVAEANFPAEGQQIWFRIMDLNEGDHSVVANAIRSADYAGTDFDPKFEIYELASLPPTRMMTGMGM